MPYATALKRIGTSGNDPNMRSESFTKNNPTNTVQRVVMKKPLLFGDTESNEKSRAKSEAVNPIRDIAPGTKLGASVNMLNINANQPIIFFTLSLSYTLLKP